MLQCFSINANDPNHFHTLQTLKEFVYSINKSAGNSYPYVDDGLDPYSTWFYVLYERELISCMRIVTKSPENRIPLERGNLVNNPNEQYRVLETEKKLQIGIRSLS